MSDGWKPPADLDPECRLLCEAMNAVPGIRTVESCSGHGDTPFRVYFLADSLDALPELLAAVGVHGRSAGVGVVSAPVQSERCSETPPVSALGIRRRVAVGTRVESRKRSVCDGDGHRRWARGVVVGHDPDLDLPTVRWEGGVLEAVEDDEFEPAR